jgi:RNA polymerase sigma factor (sigma-70 family)
MTATDGNSVAENPTACDFEQIVTHHYEALYRFAFNLTQTEADAKDLTQQTFYIWAIKGHQLRDGSKVKSWLFTTLHREFLNMRRKVVRFPHFQLVEEDEESPAVSPDAINALDAAQIVTLLREVAEPYQAPLSLFYLEEYSYKEIAEILDIALGTVQSRISRGMAQLKQLIFRDEGLQRHRTLPKPGTTEHHSGIARRNFNGDLTAGVPVLAIC